MCTIHIHFHQVSGCCCFCCCYFFFFFFLNLIQSSQSICNYFAHFFLWYAQFTTQFQLHVSLKGFFWAENKNQIRMHNKQSSIAIHFVFIRNKITREILWFFRTIFLRFVICHLNYVRFFFSFGLWFDKNYDCRPFSNGCVFPFEMVRLRFT